MPALQPAGTCKGEFIMAKLMLPRLLSDGMIIQRGKPFHLWGWTAPGRTVSGGLCPDAAENKAQSIECGADGRGRFDAYIPVPEAGDSSLTLFVDDGETKITVRDILPGTVWFCTGQSNMELPIERVKDRYPEELSADSPKIRTFKITERAVYSGPLEELESGSWVPVTPETVRAFSATAYFFAKELHRRTGEPVGIINASLGGSLISGWMSREMLEGFDSLLETADRYADEEFYSGRIRKNEEEAGAWISDLDRRDVLLRTEEPFRGEKETAGGPGDSFSWRKMQLPAMFRDTELAGFTGSVWFRRSFDADKHIAGRPMKIWLGTIVDRDTVFVNGTAVGHTDYQYPPRKYPVPEGLVREGRNTVTVRVVVDRGLGRFTPGKDYCLFPADYVTPSDAPEDEVIRLDGIWEYCAGAEADDAPEADFVNWKATGLYSGMTAPCHNYPVAGVLWYQGESNTHEPWDYLELTRRQVAGYRKCWNDPDLPYIFVQLPNFVVDQTLDYEWPAFREAQRLAASIPGTGMVTAMDLGEDNDLHPLNKKELGRRLALAAMHMVFGSGEEYTGPVPVSASIREGRNRGIKEHPCVVLELSHADGLEAAPPAPGKEDAVRDFVLTDAAGRCYETEAELVPGENGSAAIRLHPLFTVPGEISGVRYLYSNTARGRMIVNGSGLPMSPFCMEVRRMGGGEPEVEQ